MIIEEMKLPLAQLKAGLEQRAESISSSAQLLMADAPAHDGSRVASDLRGILGCAREMFALVHGELQPAHFEACGTTMEEEMQRIRHEVRGLLNSILGRAQFIAMEPDLSPAMTGELQRLTKAGRECVELLNSSRDEPLPAGDVTPHLLVPRPGPPENILAAPAARMWHSQPALVLVADDNPQSRELLGRFLEKQGHTPEFAADGAQAVAMLEARDFDLVLLDLDMPELNGYEVLDRLRSSGALRCTPVIVVSGADSEKHAVRAIEMGAEDFLARPIDLGLLRARVNAALERLRLREREFAQFFTTGLARWFLRHPDLLNEGRRAEVSVLFVDVVGFSRISERLGPVATMQWLGQVMEVFSQRIQKCQGVVVDYTGDQIMALWGAPQTQPAHADLACEAALSLWDCLPAINAAWEEKIGEPTAVTIGINTGDAFVGNVGTQQKFKYGALGNTVNLASRIQAASKYVRSSVMLSGECRAELRQPVNVRRLTRVQLNNIERPVDLYELATAPSQEQAGLFADYEQALALLEENETRRASALLGEILKRHPDDGPSLLLLSRAVDTMLHGGGVFDPVWVLPGK